MEAETDVIARIEKVTVSHFRGFQKTHSIDTNADLVLITGPNGYGKTSLLEALSLVLTEWRGLRDPKTELLAQRPGKGGKPGSPHGDDGFFICAEGRTVGQGKRALSLELEWPGTDRGELTVLGLPRSRLMPPADAGTEEQRRSERDDGRELTARLCAFFQDHVEEQFDEVARGRTLRDVFEPLPRGIKEVRSQLSGVVEELMTRIAEPPPQWHGLGEDRLWIDLRAAYAAFRPQYLKLAATAEHWAAVEEDPQTVDDDAAMDAFARRVLQASGVLHRYDGPELRDRFEAAVSGAMDRQKELVGRRAAGRTREGSRLRQRLEKLEDEVRRIRDEYPRLEEDLVALSAGEPGQPDALAVFRVLAHSARRWSRVQFAAGEVNGALLFARALEELRAVEEDQAAVCAEAIAAWLEPRRDAGERLRELDREAQQVRSALKHERASEELDRLGTFESTLKQTLAVLLEAWKEGHRFRDYQAHSAKYDADVTWWKEALTVAQWSVDRLDDLTHASGWLQEELQRLAGKVLWRFNLVDGTLPLHLSAEDRSYPGDPYRTRSIYAVRTDDGRELCHLSTGQRAQMAIALLVSQNLALSGLGYLNHQIILLDDMTAAYDLSNLTREAILWRQIAYGENDKQRRQVFISSHHEDMTNHLLDLLVPPEGRSMRLLRFIEWSPSTGPVIEESEVIPTRGRSGGPEGLADLKCDLKAF